MTSLTSRLVWPQLLSHGSEAAKLHLRDLFDKDPGRAGRFALRAGALYLDYSRERVTAETLPLLTRLAEEAGLAPARKKLFDGEVVNASENHPALHPAMRAREPSPEIYPMRERALDFAERLRTGQIKNALGIPLRHVIHVGIGGSELGPRLLTEALADGRGPQAHFIASTDPAPLRKLMAWLKPEATLVLLASKSFSTAEVLHNGRVLQGWLGEKWKKHILAATAAPEAAATFGVPGHNIFPMHKGVGGRFSLWASVSLSAMAAMGRKAFEEFLQGGAEMDAHFQNAPWMENMPVLLALLGVWNTNILNCKSRAVLPYGESLRLWPAYLQQLEMESLGKSVGLDKKPVDYATAPVIFGATGTPAQHAFMQALHQGTEIIPSEILIVSQDKMLQAHALAQAEALAFGKEDEDAQKNVPGNMPCSVLALDGLTPRALGNLVVLYEHKVFVQGVLWNLNPFDQWGVELGKKLAGPMEAALSGGVAPAHLSALLKVLRKD
ncbi:MAG: glucose-6-phosphate isomerase [Proteobacteria bacterium]|nr:glucose-6-phosphate isomerase [Pseudomonadota bacterium]